MKGLLIFLFLWTPLCLFIVFQFPLWFDAKSRLNLGVILRLVGGLPGFYYLVARKWRH